MNVFDGVVSGGVVKLGDSISLPCHTQHEGEASVGIRPEHLVLDSAGPMQLDVDYAEPLGSTTLLYGAMANGTVALTACLTGVHNQVQQKISLNIAPENIHFFDKLTGLRIN